MQKNIKDLVLLKDDYQLLIGYLRGSDARNLYNRQDAEYLESELKKASLVEKKDFPADVIRLNSRVTISDEKNNKEIKLILVTPEKANIRDNKISVLAPVGTALIGYRKGQKVMWQVPGGMKTFMILDVTNE
jgi:regulator of nucleoside diphosphate kinase